MVNQSKAVAVRREKRGKLKGRQWKEGAVKTWREKKSEWFPTLGFRAV